MKSKRCPKCRELEYTSKMLACNNCGHVAGKVDDRYVTREGVATKRVKKAFARDLETHYYNRKMMARSPGAWQKVKNFLTRKRSVA